MTPFVPPQHIYDRHGKEKPGRSLRLQIFNELQNHSKPRVNIAQMLRAEAAAAKKRKKGKRRGSR
jgi:hypothetical protein